MTTLRAFILALAGALLLAGCGNQGKSASAPATVQATAGDTSAVVSFPMEPNVDYWLFYAPSSGLTSTNFTTLAGGRVLVNAVSPQGIAGLVNGTTYYFTINGRTNNGPGGPGTSLVSATPRAAGGSWVLGPPLSGASELRGAAFGTVFVVVGGNGAMYSTPDGVSWTPLSRVVPNDLYAAFFGGGRYLAVGAGGVMLLSTDAVTWTLVSSATPNHLYAGASTGATYVAVGAGGTFTISADGQNWATGNAGTANDLFGLAFGNGRWVAVGANGVIVTSVDGTTWQAAASPTSSDLKAVTYGVAAALFVAVGAGGTVVTSPDGVNWTSRGSISSTLLTGVNAYSQFVAVGSNGGIFMSPDGYSWRAASSGTNSNLNAVAFGNFRFLATGAAGTNLYAN